MRSLGALLVALAVLVSAACGDGGEDRDDDASSSSRTPAVTAGTEGPLSVALLTAKDLEAVPALGALDIAAIDAAQLYEDPDPRGPCGAPVLPLPMVDAVGRSFTGDDRILFQVVVTDPAVGRLMEERLADVREPCGPYESTTNTGATQRVHDIRVSRLDGAEGYASTAAIDSEGSTTHVVSLAVRSGDRLSFVLGLAPQPTDLADVTALANRLADRIDR